MAFSSLLPRSERMLPHKCMVQQYDFSSSLITHLRVQHVAQPIPGKAHGQGDQEDRHGCTWATGRLGNGMEFGQDMAGCTRKERWRFRALALPWLPAGVAAQAMVRFGADTGPPAEPGMWLATAPTMAVSLLPVSPCGLPIALWCRRLWWLGYQRGVWMVGIGLGTATVAASVVAGLLGPIAIALYAVVLSVEVWIAWYWLLRRG